MMRTRNMSPRQHRSNRKRRLEAFSKADKLRLIKAVKVKRELWDLSNKKHSDSNAISVAWLWIGRELGKSAIECKNAWLALKDSNRYHIKLASTKRFKKSGDSGPRAVDWEFAGAMTFLPNTSTMLTTLLSEQAQSEPSPPVAIHEQSVPDSIADSEPEAEPEPELTFQHQKARSTPKKTNLSSSPVAESISSAIDSLVSQTNRSADGQVQQQGLKHIEMLTFWDTILRKMSDEAIVDVQLEVTVKILQIAKKHKDNKN